jgi:phage baseplate assembly protein W
MADFYDISLDFSLDSTGDIKLVEDNTAIVQSIKNIIFTSVGGKHGTGSISENFGVGLKDYLFASLTAFEGRSLGEAIDAQVSIYEPRIYVQNIQIGIDTTARRFDIQLDYVLKSSGKQFTFRTALNQI